LDRIFATIIYIALVASGSCLVVTLGKGLASDALAQIAFHPAETRVTRVERVLAAKAQDLPIAQTAARVVPIVPPIAVGDLARGMDEAEHSSSQPGQLGTAVTTASITTEPGPANMTDRFDEAVPDYVKPRVAGWIRRLPKKALSRSDADETSAHIIMRSLRAEM
jgi:hypothetical protein